MIEGGFDHLMSDLRGGVSLEEARFLRELAANVAAGCILEVGSFCGKSAVALAIGAKETCRHVKIDIYCIEPHRTFTGYYGGIFGPKDRAVFYEVMLKTGFYRDVALINASSEVVAPGWNEPIGLLFIDGDHRYESVTRDYRCWSQHVLDAGIIAFDDATDPKCGPQRIIAELLADGRFVEFARVGKIVALKKLDSAKSQSPATYRAQRILVACDYLVLSGGMLRMERTAARLSAWGHNVTFLAFNAGGGTDFPTGFEVINFDAAATQSWEAVLVPGAGFSEETIRDFARLRAPQFGTRVQLVLNDMSRREGFLAVNRSFAPAVVIFNNRAWPPGTFTDFTAVRFHVLEGAVDTAAFRPLPYRKLPVADGIFTIGGLVNKNPAPLLQALRFLPERIKLRLFGQDVLSLALSERDLISQGRLELTGVLHHEDLCAFYDDVDMICMTEMNAGWSNLVAEAMASGLPVVCTRHGTAAIAHHDFTALVVQNVDARELATSIGSLASDPGLCERLGRNARRAIEPFDWDSYAQKLLDLIRPDGRSHYYHTPELGLHGKWPIADRMDGLQDLISVCRGTSVLDLGAAEGLVARAFLESGATLVHGFDNDASRVAAAAALLQPWPQSYVRHADLSDRNALQSQKGPALLDRYDIVLYLGLHHHLPAEHRLELLEAATAKAAGYFAIRTPAALIDADGIGDLMQHWGFAASEVTCTMSGRDGLGPLHLFKRH